MTPDTRQRVLVLGAGFGGLELTAILSETFGDAIDLTLIDQSEAFVFGFSKLDVMFGRATLDDVRIPYRTIAKPGVRVLQQVITAIDPAARRVTTEGGVFDADFLVIALGADYDLDATPGLAEAGNEFYTVEGAARVRELLPAFSGGRVIVGVCGAPYKCPPAPSETALMLHDYFDTRGIRDRCEITAVLPWASPVPPSSDTSRALVAAFAERNIHYLPNHRVASLDGVRRVAVLDDGAELPYDLFLGIPKHCVPKVVAASGMAADGWIKVNPRTLESAFPRTPAHPRRECSPRAPRAPSRVHSARHWAVPARPFLTPAPAPATSSSAAAAWPRWTSTSSPVPSPSAISGSLPRRAARKSISSGRAGARDGSAVDAARRLTPVARTPSRNARY